MILPEKDLNRLVSRAAFLYERVAYGWEPEPDLEGGGEAMLVRWCQLAAGGDEALFEQRLAWDRLDRPHALSLVCDGALKMPLSQLKTEWPWIDLLVAVLERAAQTEIPTADDIPAMAGYEMVLRPFIAEAEAQLAQVAERDLLRLLQPAAYTNLTDYLTQQLLELATPTFDFITKSLHNPYSDQPADLSFVMAIQQQGLTELCQAYPVLARQLASCVGDWVAEVQAFLQRLTADWQQIATYLALDNRLAADVVTQLQPGLSDPHGGGRTVWRVMLGEGQMIAYKPKDLTLDRAWNTLLVWCNERRVMPPLAHLWTLPCQTKCGQAYGWMAWAKPTPDVEPCGERYYHKAGMILSLLHLLQASDCHQENLVTQGDCPLLIDAEMLRYPQLAGEQAADPLNVMRTGLLPRWLSTDPGTAEICGLAGGHHSASRYRAEICAGFCEMGAFLRKNEAELEGAAGPLAPFRAEQRNKVRIAPRPTDAYLRLRAHLRHPSCLQAGIAFSIELDRLAYSYLREPATHGRLARLLNAEHGALSQRDIPLFQAEIGRSALRLDDGTVIRDCFVWPDMRLCGLLEQQQALGLIRESLDRSPYLSPWRQSSATGIDADRFVAHAASIGELLVQRAVRDETGQMNWIANRYDPRSGLHHHAFVEGDFYAGRAGIVSFLSALAEVTGEAKWGRFAHTALKGPSESEGQQRQVVSQSWGVLDGQAGELLGLLTEAEQLKDGQQRGEMIMLALCVGEKLLTREAVWQQPAEGLGGFSHGAAGIAYALNRLYEARGDGRFLAAAQRGWAFQRSLYHDEIGKWQDRRGATPIYLDNWCNGAAGIGLAAVACLHSQPELQDVVERAADVVITSLMPDDLTSLDTLCCGRFGQIESLLEMGLLAGRPDWVGQADLAASRAIEQAIAHGSFQLEGALPPHLFNPTFFGGWRVSVTPCCGWRLCVARRRIGCPAFSAGNNRLID